LRTFHDSCYPYLPVPLLVVKEAAVVDVKVVSSAPIHPVPELEAPAGGAHEFGVNESWGGAVYRVHCASAGNTSSCVAL